MTDSADLLKAAAAERALDLVEDGMHLGLGSGTTAEVFVGLLAERVAHGLRITGVPTSKRVGQLARAQGISVLDGDDLPRLDLAVDGADEIEPRTLGLIKGRGGALLRERLVATAADRLCIIADASKLAPTLGERSPVPVAVIPFGWRQTAERIAGLGTQPELRMADGQPFLTDDSLYILDCRFGPIADPPALDAALKGVRGVVDHGLFLGLAWRALLAGPDGVAVFDARTVPA